jgi:hypothetical protein
MVGKYTKWSENIPNGHKIYRHFQLQDPPKLTQIGIFGLKMNHLATLAARPTAENVDNNPDRLNLPYLKGNLHKQQNSSVRQKR